LPWSRINCSFNKPPGNGLLYALFTLNPLAGPIDAFQNVTLRGLPPDTAAMLPGLLLTLVLLPFSYLYFKRAESYFADLI